MITFTIEADYVKDHFPKDLCHSCFHAAYIEIPPVQVQTAHLIVTLDF